jgi:hypothetical protein
MDKMPIKTIINIQSTGDIKARRKEWVRNERETEEKRKRNERETEEKRKRNERETKEKDKR